MDSSFPVLRQTVIDATDTRRLAEFWRVLLGYTYRPGSEAPHAGPDPADDLGFFLVLHDATGAPALAFQKVEGLPAATWPDGDVAQQLHLDLTVPTYEELDLQHSRALALGARMLEDRADDEEEPLRVYSDPASHPFCIFVSPDQPA
ncbi:MAG: VOC family protein [Acidimicrobiales bacterium]